LIPAGSESALKGTIDLYAAADLVLTGRLHGCIIGLAMGRKVLAVSGDHKVESFMGAAGLGDWVLGLGEARFLPDRLVALPSQPPSTQFLHVSRRASRSVATVIKRLARGDKTRH
jgi:hypothetical protein